MSLRRTVPGGRPPGNVPGAPVRPAPAAPDAAAIIASALDAIVVIDEGNIIREFNPAAERIFGWTRDQVLGRDLSLLIPEEYRERHRAGMAAHVRTGQSTVLDRRLELEALRADGTRFPMELSVSRLGPSAAPLFTAFIRDISVRRDLASQLLARSARLRDIVDSQRELAGLATTPDDLYDRIARMAHRAMGADGAAFEIQEGEVLVYRAASGMAEASVGLRIPVAGSLSGDALRSGQTLVCVDAETDPRADLVACRAQGLRSMIVSVLLDGDRPCGVVKVMSARPGAFGDDDAAALDVFVASLSEVLARLQRQSVAQRRAAKHAAILAMRERMASSDLQLQELMEEMASQALQLTSAEGAVVEFVEGGEMVYAAGSGSLGQEAGMRLPIDACLSGTAAREGKALLCRNALDDPRVNAEACRRFGTQSIVAAPFRGERDVIGVLKVVSSRPDAFTPHDLEALQELVESMGLVLQRRASADRVSESEHRYRMLFAHNPHPMWVYDLETLRFLEVNTAATDTYGYSRDEFLAMTILDVRPDEDRALVAGFLERLRTVAGATHNYAARHCRKDGTLIQVEVSGDDIILDGRKCRLVLAHDVTARHQAEHQRARAERALRMLSQSNAGVIGAKDAAELLESLCRTILDVGGYQCAVVGLVDPAPGGQRQFALVRGGGPAGQRMARAFELDGLAVPEELAVLGPEAMTPAVASTARDGGLASMVILPLHDELCAVGVLAMFSDTAETLPADERALLIDLVANVCRGLAALRAEVERRRISAALDFAATHDPLTGLERFAVAQARIDARLARGEPLALLLVELDRFAAVNQTLSHDAADDVLRQIGARLAPLADDAIQVTHLSGDEFVLVMPAQDTREVTRIAEFLRLDVGRPLDVAGFRLNLTATVGIALAPDHGDSAVELLRRAEAAAEQGKGAGRNCVSWFSADAMQTLDDRINLGPHLRKAVDRGELELVYQPQFRSGEPRPIGFEALLRWNNALLGEVSPVRFIPVAENLGLMTEIGNWVVLAACRQIRAWLDAGLDGFTVAVNVSSLQLQRPGLVATVAGALAQHRVPPACLELEITESALMENLERARVKLQRLADMGISVSLDDFGTGYSSLAYLKVLHLHKLKIDKAFVHGLPDDARDAAMARTIVSIAHQFGLSVAAEGVETPEQATFLASIGCDLLQGFLLARPMSPDAAASLLLTR